jgi:hypothetical protein
VYADRAYKEDEFLEHRRPVSTGLPVASNNMNLFGEIR